ncbi:MAG: type II secretion system protein N [Alphaproteobacteria bacterium]|nr:type II secretion system protein N [Alphaproteobacteria bacterium]
MISIAGIGQPLRSSLLAVLELVCLASVGAGAAALFWALVTPVGALAGSALPPAALAGQPTSLSAALLDDPFLRTGAGAMAQGSLATSPDYVLHSTRVGGWGEGSAILSTPGQPQAAYSVGDAIGPGARLVSVSADRVEVEQSGGRKMIAFAPIAGGSAASLAGPPPVTAGPGSAPIDRASLMNAMVLRPVERGGSVAGFEIIPRGASAPLVAAGLQPGDVVTDVNGLRFSEESLPDLQAQILGGGPIEIRFERAGQTMTTKLEKVAP